MVFDKILSISPLVWVKENIFYNQTMNLSAFDTAFREESCLPQGFSFDIGLQGGNCLQIVNESPGFHFQKN